MCIVFLLCSFECLEQSFFVEYLKIFTLSTKTMNDSSPPYPIKELIRQG